MGKKVLIVATSIYTKGGITSVLKEYKQNKIWNDWRCFWLSSHIDRSQFIKFAILIYSLCKFVFLLPFYDIIHIHFSEPSSAKRKSIFIFIAKLFNKKILTHFHSFSIDTTINGRYKALYHRIFTSSDKIIVLSEQWRIWLTDKWPELNEKIKVLYNPCPHIENTDQIYSKTKAILYAGTLNERKGYADLIKAFALISDSNKEWQLVFAGNGELDKAKQLCQKYNIQEKVIFEGWVTGTKKEELFNTASIFCLPSYAEGFPMAVLDAWAFGLPVITTPVGGLPDVLIHEKNSMIFNPGDITQLSRHLEKLISDENLRLSLSDESLKLSLCKFSMEEISQELSDVYEELSC